MMQTQAQTLDAPVAGAFQAKVQPQMNSQGEIIESTEPQQQLQEQLSQPQAGPRDSFEDVVSLGDTILAHPLDGLFPPTDDTGLVHEIISCGHVLKSTHDLARWSEKTGARRVNGIESIDSISDLAINLEPFRGGARRRTNNNGNNGNNNNNNNNGNNSDPTDSIRGLFSEGGNGKRGGRRNGNKGEQQLQQQQQWKPVDGDAGKSEVLNCWPVLKSTHDQALLSEKRGRNAVNQAGTSGSLEELALNQQGGQGQKGVQAGGNSLSSGMDTQAGSHVTLDDATQKMKETPEMVMEELHVHV